MECEDDLEVCYSMRDIFNTEITKILIYFLNKKPNLRIFTLTVCSDVVIIACYFKVTGNSVRFMSEHILHSLKHKTCMKNERIKNILKNIYRKEHF